ncbi:hypothetical protein DVH24_021449 [Malus domestica]|uniref:Uncharacterized protein n=1 Tax=Malus domestica TaxID=3750 RepID=A0A498JXH6_MALDO|nr:hypothetical protein DVH24_021449 [Malus domestica]
MGKGIITFQQLRSETKRGIFDKGNVEVADPKANKLSTDTSSDLKGIRSSVLRFFWICNVDRSADNNRVSSIAHGVVYML